MWAAEADRAEIGGVGVDPVALDTQLAGEGGGIDEAGGALRLLVAQQLDNAPGDCLDQLRVFHGPVVDAIGHPLAS